MTKPASISLQNLTTEQQESNKAILSLLFKSPAYNQPGVANFAGLTTIRLRRDDDRNEAFAQAISTLIEHRDASLSPTDVAVPSKRSVLIQDLLDALAARRIVLDRSGLFALTRDAQENRKRMRDFFQDCLTIHYFEKEAAHLQRLIEEDKQSDTPLLVKHNDLSAYLSDGIKRKVDTREENIKQRLSSIELRENLTLVQTLGDGDCFYHATMLNIIYQILTNQIEENSETARQIQSSLLPAINQELQTRGAPALDFSGLSVKQSILLLLRTISLDRLTKIKSEQLFFFSTPNENNDFLISSVQSCGFYHLLRDICAPVLRKMMLTQLANHEEEVKELLKNTAVSYWISHFAKELGFSNKDKLMLATQTWNNAELSDAEPCVKETIESRWNRVIQKIRQQAKFKALKSEEEKIQFLHEEYKKYWMQNKALELSNYRAIHAGQGTMAGPVQQLALMNALHVNMNLVHKSTYTQAPLTSKSEARAITFLYEYQNAHFNAYAQKDKNPSLADALHHMMHLTLQSNTDFRESTYQWKPASTWSLFNKYKREGKEVSARVLKKAEISIKNTQVLLSEVPYAKELLDKEARTSPQTIFAAAKTGYKGFFESVKEKESISEDEEKSIALAIELQNEEIHSYLLSKGTVKN